MFQSCNNIGNKLSPHLICAGLSTKVVARQVHCFSSIDSTNRIAKQYARSGVLDGTVVVAEKQTRGRGRMDRTWISPAGTSILCSIVFYPSLPAASVFRLTMLASVAVVAAVNRACGIKAQIKWPNDVFIKGKKLCGILSEISADNQTLHHVVIGIGININVNIKDCPEIEGIATSLKEETGREVSRLHILKTLLKEIDMRYTSITEEDSNSLKKEWEQHSMILGRHVKIVSEQETVSGIAKGINMDGHLILIDSQGITRDILCGDLSLCLQG